MCCPQCGGIAEVCYVDSYDGVLYQCETCGAKSDHTEVIEEGEQAEALREKRENDIDMRQYSEWLAARREMVR